MNLIKRDTLKKLLLLSMPPFDGRIGASWIVRSFQHATFSWNEFIGFYVLMRRFIGSADQ